MLKYKKIFIAVTIAVIVILAGSYVFLKINGQRLIVEKLSQALNRKISIGSIHVLFPSGLLMTNLKVDGLLTAKKAVVKLGLPDIISRDVNFSVVQLKEPIFKLERQRKPEENESAPAVQDQVPASLTQSNDAPSQKSTGGIHLTIDKLIIENGRFEYSETAPEKNFQVTVRDIFLNAKRLSFPFKSMSSKFDVLAKVDNLDQGRSAGDIKAQGWVNFLKKDMAASVNITELDSRVFALLYAKPQESQTVRMLLDATANLEANNNDLAVQCQLKIKGISFQEDKEGGGEALSTEDFILKAFQTSGQTIAVNFNFKTKLDNFQIDSIPFAGSVSTN